MYVYIGSISISADKIMLHIYLWLFNKFTAKRIHYTIKIFQMLIHTQRI